MKKTLFAFCLLCIIFFYSCEKKNDTTNYLDNKIIEGTWHELTEAPDSSLFIFKGGKATEKFFAKIIDMEELKAPVITEMGKYLLTDKYILLSGYYGGKLPYELSPDSKTIRLKTSENWWTFEKIED